LRNLNEDLWKRLNLVNDWIKTADLKASFITIASVAVLGFLIPLNNNLNVIESFIFLIALLTGLTSLIMSILVNLPVLKKSEAINGLIYYGDIESHRNSESFYQSLSSQSDDDITKDLSNQVYENSRIAFKKMRRVGLARYPFLISCGSIFLLISGVIDFSINLIKQIP
jgi:hypothetical protein